MFICIVLYNYYIIYINGTYKNVKKNLIKLDVITNIVDAPINTIMELIYGVDLKFDLI